METTNSKDRYDLNDLNQIWIQILEFNFDLKAITILKALDNNNSRLFKFVTLFETFFNMR